MHAATHPLPLLRRLVLGLASIALAMLLAAPSAHAGSRIKRQFKQPDVALGLSQPW